MIILIGGGQGFIGKQIAIDLADENKIIYGGRKNVGSKNDAWIQADFSETISLEEWQKKLSVHSHIDVFINCIGAVSGNDETIWNIQYYNPKNLINALLSKGLKKIIQISALGVEQVEVSFATSKRALDEFILQLPIPAVILRPSLVYGSGSYGGSSLFRGLAGLPGFIPLPGKGEQLFQPIHIADLSRAVQKLLQDEQTGIFNAVGSEQYSLSHLLFTLRRWLGFGRALKLSVPISLIKWVVKIGDFFKTTVNSTLFTMLLQNNIVSSKEYKRFQEAIGFAPVNFEVGLFKQPSYVQDRWHARLYFLRPILRISIAFVWLITPIASLFLTPQEESIALLNNIHLPYPYVWLYGASLLNFILGLATLFNYRLRLVGSIQILLMVIYTVIISIWLPHYWQEPFGPVLKNIPLIVATAVMMAMESNR